MKHIKGFHKKVWLWQKEGCEEKLLFLYYFPRHGIKIMTGQSFYVDAPDQKVSKVPKLSSE